MQKISANLGWRAPFLWIYVNNIFGFAVVGDFVLKNKGIIIGPQRL